MTCKQQLELIREYLKCELDSDEALMREHIQEELRFDPVLTHGGETEVDPAVLEEAVTAKLYDISGMDIDTEAGVGFTYGHMFAMSELRYFLTVIEADPAEAHRILAIKQGVYPTMSPPVADMQSA